MAWLRAAEPAAAPDGVPGWVTTFDAAAWSEQDDGRGADGVEAEAVYRSVRAHARWRAAAVGWLVEHRGTDELEARRLHYRLLHPGVADAS